MRRHRGFKSYNTPPPIKQIIVVTIIFFMISTGFSIWFINRGIEPTLMEIAETKTRQFARLAINEAISKKIAEDLSFDDLVQMEKDNNGNIVAVGWNTEIQNRVQRNATNRVQNFLKQLERGEVPEPGTPLDVEIDPEDDLSLDSVRGDPTIAEIPVGQATGITILSNLGPRIPVNFEVIGDVQSDIVMEHEDVGINGALFQVYAHIVVHVRIVIPFSTAATKIEQVVPIDSRTIMGEVPQYYNGGSSNGNDDPGFSFPLEPIE